MATRIEESFFLRSATSMASSMLTTSVAGTTRARSWRKGSSAAGAPTRSSCASGCASRKWRHAVSVTRGPWSPPMQSTARMVVMAPTVGVNRPICGRRRDEGPAAPRGAAGPRDPVDAGSGVVLGLHDLAAAIEARGADVVTQVRFARGGLHRDARRDQGIVRTVHAALGRRLLVLLDSHDGLLESVRRAQLGTRSAL